MIEKTGSPRDQIYGLNPAFECLRAERRIVHGLYVNRSVAEQARPRKLVALCAERSIPVRFVDKGELFRICGTVEHQGIVLETGSYPYVSSASLFAEDRLLLLDNIEDPHNIGAILRSAEAFGFTAILLPNRGCPEIYPSVVKASAGASEHLRIARDAHAVVYAKRALEDGHAIVALDAKGSVPMAAFREAVPKRFMLVIGGEDRSVGQFILNAANAVVALPRRGQINSLNASVAAGIALHELS